MQNVRKMKMNKEIIRLEPFEVVVNPPKYLVGATADVWYDLTGIFHIYGSVNKQHLLSIEIKNNSKQNEQIARYLFDYLIPSEFFEVLEPWDNFKTLYKLTDGLPLEEVRANKFLYEDLRDEISQTMMIHEGNAFTKSETPDLSDSRFCISNTIEELPVFLENWCNGWAFDEIFVFDKTEKKFIYHFYEYCPYSTGDDEITDKRQDFAMSFCDEEKYLMLTPINAYSSLWLNENNTVLPLIEKMK